MRADRSHVSLLVLAGGRGSRLGGTRKALLEVGGRPILRRVLDAIGPLAADQLVLVDQPIPEHLADARPLVDAERYAGVLPALAGALDQARGEACLVVAGDMPFVSPQAFTYLLSLYRSERVDVVVPWVGGVLQPMHAVVRREPALDAVRQAIRAGERRFFRVLLTLERRDVDEAELRAIDPDLWTLFNVNTPEDLVTARQLAAAR